MLHETAHIWLGVDDLYNDRHNRTDGVNAVEVMCNAVAGELIAPKQVFLKKWEDNTADVYAFITDLAGYFRCGESVIARKALDCKKITQDVYNKVVQTAIDNYNQIKEERESSGGNYYSTMGTRLDGHFVKALCESINMGRTSYTEAFRLTNTSGKTFPEVPSSGLSPKTQNKNAKIPDVAKAFGARTDNLYYMMKKLEIKI